MKLVQVLYFIFLMLFHPRTYALLQCSALFRLTASGHRLTGNVIYEYETLGIMECALRCQALEKPSCCRSINFKARNKRHSPINCQLNSVTKTVEPWKLQIDDEYDYYEEFPRKNGLTGDAAEQVVGKSCGSLCKSCERKNGIYTIDPDGLGSFQVWCDMTPNGGGWTVFQRRIDASVDFYRGWSDYKAGFGDLNGNFWLGFEKINRLIKYTQSVLRVDLMDFDNTTAFAQYGTFSVAPESESYKLDVGDFSGNAGDSLHYHNGMKFTTKDKDNDHSSVNCALPRKGAWWYRACAYSNLNGPYLSGGIGWHYWKNDGRSMKRTEMKLRPVEY